VNRVGVFLLESGHQRNPKRRAQGPRTFRGKGRIWPYGPAKQGRSAEKGPRWPGQIFFSGRGKGRISRGGTGSSFFGHPHRHWPETRPDFPLGGAQAPFEQGVGRGGGRVGAGATVAPAGKRAGAEGGDGPRFSFEGRIRARGRLEAKGGGPGGGTGFPAAVKRGEAYWGPPRGGGGQGGPRGAGVCRPEGGGGTGGGGGIRARRSYGGKLSPTSCSGFNVVAADLSGLVWAALPFSAPLVAGR